MKEELSASDILRLLKDAYAKCFTYQDEGGVEASLSNKFFGYKVFRTSFIRPNQFRFECHEIDDGSPRFRHIIAQNVANTFSWSSLQPGVEELESLHLGLGGAAGISHRSSTIAPALLMPGTPLGFPFGLLENLKRLPDEMINGTECYSIEGNYKLDMPSKTTILDAPKATFIVSKIVGYQKISIDKVSLLIHRIEDETSTSQMPNAKSIISYEPKINAPISLEQIKFNPPNS